MFTQPCFIRKNTPELRKKLEKLGYIHIQKNWKEENINECHTLHTNADGCYWHHHTEFRLKDFFKTHFDCGTNEDLFLALAALRDDSDEYQWFTDGNGWLKCQYEYIEDEVQEARECHYFGATVYNCHKATVEELVEHFKK